MKCSTSISSSFGKFLATLVGNKEKHHNDITYQIFYDIFRIREAQWKYKIDCKRGVNSSLSDIFQDIVAHYLRQSLSKEYIVYLEYNKGKQQPDILIKKNKDNWAILEIKTNIGHSRDLIKNNNYLVRLKELSKEFRVPLKRVFYIFESSSNVGRDFAAKFNSARKTKITRFILPLFRQSVDPRYIGDGSGILRRYTETKIADIYKQNIITDWKQILRKIIS